MNNLPAVPPPEGWLTFCKKHLDNVLDSLEAEDIEGAKIQAARLRIGLHGLELATEKILADIVAREELQE